jgi:hypothetical protein
MITDDNEMTLTFLAYTPFMQPLHVWNYWPWLLLPLCFGVSVVYKSVREHRMARVPTEAAKATFWIVLAMAAAAVGLFLMVRYLA